MKTTLLFVFVLRFLTAGMYAQESVPKSPLQIVLTADKAVYRLGEKMHFRATIKNAGTVPVGVLVRGFDWDDLVRLDGVHRESLARAAHDPRWTVRPNLADELRAENLPCPLGHLDLIQDPAPGSSVRLGGFDVDGLFCGTGLKNGMMPAGIEVKHDFSVGPNVTWGPVGAYRFIWRASSPRHENGGSPEPLTAVSNVLDITLVQ